MENAVHDGLYYYNLEAPQQQGVYPVIAKCYYSVTQTTELADSYTLNTGTYVGGAISDTYTINSVYLRTKEANVGGVQRIEQDFDFDNMCSPEEDVMTGISLQLTGRWNSITNDDITISIYNFSDNSWLPLPNKLYAQNGLQTISNSLDLTNLTTSGLVDGSGTLTLRLNDTTLSDTSSERLRIDYMDVKCDELSGDEWQEIKGSSEIHISSDSDYEAIITEGRLRNDTFYDGFDLYYTIASGVRNSEEDVEIKLPTFKNAFPCDHINDVQRRNNTGESFYSVEFTEYLADENLCGVIINEPLDPRENFDIRIRMDNFWKREGLTHYLNTQYLNEILEISCIAYQNASDYPPYTVPLLSGIPVNDTLYEMCYSYFDYYFAYNLEFITTFLPIIGGEHNFTKVEMEDLEGKYEHSIQTATHLQELGESIMHGLNLADSYSLSIISDPYPPVNPQYATFFANISSSFLNYGSSITNFATIPSNIWTDKNRTLNNSLTEQDIWDYNNRTLSTFNFSTSINKSAIAEEVWNYSGTVETSLIAQFVSDIWGAVTRTLTAFTFDVIDEEEVSNNVWNNTARYTHGVDLS